MSEGYPGGGGEGGQQQQQPQVVVDGCVAGGGGSCLPFYHVPQQCRREKLRYPNANDPPPLPLHPHAPTPSPPSLMHYNPTATTVSFMSPVSSSSYHLLNPSSSSAAAPYDHHGGVAAFNLLDPHALFGGAADHHPQVQGVSLSLSSSVASSSHHGHLLAGAPHATGPLPLVPVAPRQLGPVPAGPFTGYATILKGSRFLRPAQQLLEEVCGGGSGRIALGLLAGSGAEAEPSDFVAAEGVDECDKIVDGAISGEQRRVKARLVSMLDEVYRRYKLYYQQIHAVITSFEAVAGLNMAAPYAPLALKSLAKHFKCLKHAISDQLRYTDEAFGKGSRGKDEISGFRFNMNGNFCYPRTGLSSGPVNQQPVWRPQRGLPERAVAVLRAWLFEHFLHPYPSDMDKQMLAKQTGLSRNQVSNWFINARVRLWKPMVEEIHSLEVRQGRKGPEAADHNIRSTGINRQHELSSSSVFSPANHQTPPNASPRRNEALPHRRFHNELAHIMTSSHIQEPVSFSLDDLPSHHHNRVGVPMGLTNGGSGGVSLTLGLHHQNNGICLSEPLPLNVVRRFGLEESTNVAYVMGGFEGGPRTAVWEGV